MIDDEILTRLSDLGDHLDDHRRHHPSRVEHGHDRSHIDLQQHRRQRDGRSRRLPAVAGAVVLVGVVAIGLVAIRHRDLAPADRVPMTTTPTSEPIKTYRGSDLDTSRPLVGRAWLNSMEFSLDRHTNARIYDVWQASIADCMHQRGFDYQPVPFPDNGTYGEQVNPLDRGFATIMGYHLLPADPIDPNTPTEETAIAGGDCANAAYASTFGQLGKYIDDNDQLSVEFGRAIAGFETADTGLAATAAWADCMADAGYDYASPADPIRIYGEASMITAEEIATRLADLDCDVAVGYTQAKHDWEAARVETWRAGNHDAIQGAIAARAHLEQQLALLEIDLFGSSRE